MTNRQQGITCYVLTLPMAVCVALFGPDSDGLNAVLGTAGEASTTPDPAPPQTSPERPAASPSLECPSSSLS